jgi:hypothetical protein
MKLRNINQNLGKKLALVMAISTFILPLDPAFAQKATRIKFARGSYCGSYSGNFSQGREFVLNLGSGQRFTSRNIGGGIQYDIYVTGPKGRISGEKVAKDQIEYYIPVKGDYYIYIESTTSFSNVEFCAY